MQGWKVRTSPVPIKDPYFATLKSNNYLPNALVALDAQLEGFDQVRHHPITAGYQKVYHEEMNIVSTLKGFEILITHAQGVFVDSNGYVAEGSVMNIGIITHEGELVVPPFDQALPGCTLKRLLQLIREVCLVPQCSLCMLRYVQHSPALLCCQLSRHLLVEPWSDDSLNPDINGETFAISMTSTTPAAE